MNEQVSVAVKRAQLLQELFPGGVPRLWCPPLTHYDRDGAIDAARIRAHLRYLSRYIKGFLIPGSTGDGWDMSPEEIRQVVEIGLDEAQRLHAHVLIGVLKADAQEARSAIKQTSAWLQTRSPNGPIARPSSPVPLPVGGFTVCAPRGNHLSEQQIGDALGSVLELGLPTALYQLPQMTQNELSPEVASELAERFPNFLLFKDSSGADRVVLSGKGLGGVFTMRGGEGDYARWLKPAAGPYDGFLLGSANCFAAELQQIIQDVAAGRFEAAGALSMRVTAVVKHVAELAARAPAGNTFANANKAIDHFFAWGPRAAELTPPRLRQGTHLPLEIIRAAGESLSRYTLMPQKGYL